MILMGSGYLGELPLEVVKVTEERRESWIDLYLRLQLRDHTELPEGAEEISAWVICNKERYIVQTVLLLDGCDSAYQFTPQEKKLIYDYLLDHNWVKGSVEEEKPSL
ncbi:hypothetical protein [Paenibacillus senegalensis]|uniref:hypothetical protein n=1 Tax=Paenibacillus senegalensis TaxID=1465766 RepID=UPI000289AF72|nr:hypothetical protein [Paenibacillus senegalensis]